MTLGYSIIHNFYFNLCINIDCTYLLFYYTDKPVYIKLRTYAWYPSNRNITNTQHSIFPNVKVKNQTMIFNILFETNSFPLDIRVLRISFCE